MKKYFSITTSLVLFFALLFSFGNIKTKNTYATSPAIIHSGTLHETNINYTLDENGLLTISGTGVIPNDYEGDTLDWYQWKNDITAVDIKNGITSIGDSSFYDYTNLTKVTLADSVQIIDISAFACCTNLTEINFPSTMNTINMSAFEGCSSLENVTLPNGITKLSRGLFKNCTNLTTVNIPNSVEEFETNIFYGCTSLKSLTLPKNITTIDKDYTFNGSNFEKIYIPCDSNFNFHLSEYVVSYDNGTTYLSDTNVELLESHNFGSWINIGNGKQQRECPCGHTETTDITDNGNQNNNPDNNLNNNNTTPTSKPEKNNIKMICIVVGVVLVSLTTIIVGIIYFSKRKRNTN